MTLSIFDIFKIGIGPSSSHTVGPMRAARNFARSLQQVGQLPQVRALRVELYGSLAATGRGHGTDRGIMLGLMGEAPDTVDPERIGSLIDGVRQARELRLWNSHPVAFDPDKDFSYHLKPMTEHPNGMRFSAFDAQGQLLRTERYLSIGGGFIQGLDAAQADEHRPAGAPVPYPFENGAQLMIPAKLTAEQAQLAQNLAREAFLALDGEGMSRVDLFLDKNTGQFYFNEVNTIPGFTHISMYPKMWEASGIPYRELLSRLVDLAIVTGHVPELRMAS